MGIKKSKYNNDDGEIYVILRMSIRGVIIISSEKV